MVKKKIAAIYFSKIILIFLIRINERKGNTILKKANTIKYSLHDYYVNKKKCCQFCLSQQKIINIKWKFFEKIRDEMMQTAEKGIFKIKRVRKYSFKGKSYF